MFDKKNDLKDTDENDITKSTEDNSKADGNKDDEKNNEVVDMENLKKQLIEKEALIEDYYNRLARAQADYENLKRRMNEERERLTNYAAENLITDILPVLDNFQRALENQKDCSDEFVAGVEMIYKQLQDILKKDGVEEMNPLGEDFDPNKHEAVMQVESEEYEENKIIEVLRKGYILKDKVIRPAMVKVAK